MGGWLWRPPPPRICCQVVRWHHKTFLRPVWSSTMQTDSRAARITRLAFRATKETRMRFIVKVEWGSCSAVSIGQHLVAWCVRRSPMWWYSYEFPDTPYTHTQLYVHAKLLHVCTVSAADRLLAAALKSHHTPTLQLPLHLQIWLIVYNNAAHGR